MNRSAVVKGTVSIEQYHNRKNLNQSLSNRPPPFRQSFRQQYQDPDGDVLMRDVIDEIKKDNIDRGVDLLGEYLSRYKKPNPFE